MKKSKFSIRITTEADHIYASTIIQEMAASASKRGTGIARRSVQYIEQKMLEGKAVIALNGDNAWAGFCYIESWDHEKYVVNSGLIVAPEFRNSGLAKAIKSKIFQLSQKKYPDAKIFGLTTGSAVMKINSALGYKPVSYSHLTKDEEFWKGCQSCVNYDILQSKNRENCICTAMLYTPKPESKRKALRNNFTKNIKLFERWTRIKKHVMLKLKQHSHIW
jgi:GNAT superfamily N-acetyltransferase